ncbi:hypothetical protein Astex_1378 [Asticcacaulis excentricus CB 48]|uniref:Uncharacterized protein n=1 Tax=Asticcacaulis excentricus (strain ATCC 15261 / DSM 4724 / KCTC 12464 / NCIMB 9791 / VKM B-1370 / CB 48) TaxID=573065 RepID=E8RPF0_ASTEC|nr:hypothetical protein Astex_1378 [Asticcacaulis excentricus CB 48]
MPKLSFILPFASETELAEANTAANFSDCALLFPTDDDTGVIDTHRHVER